MSVVGRPSFFLLVAGLFTHWIPYIHLPSLEVYMGWLNFFSIFSLQELFTYELNASLLIILFLYFFHCALMVHLHLHHYYYLYSTHIEDFQTRVWLERCYSTIFGLWDFHRVSFWVLNITVFFLWIRKHSFILHEVKQDTWTYRISCTMLIQNNTNMWLYGCISNT